MASDDLILIAEPMILEGRIACPSKPPGALIKAYLETLSRPFDVEVLDDFRVEGTRGSRLRSLFGNPDPGLLYIRATVTFRPVPPEHLQVRAAFHLASPWWATPKEKQALESELEGLLEYLKSFV